MYTNLSNRLRCNQEFHRNTRSLRTLSFEDTFCTQSSSIILNEAQGRPSDLEQDNNAPVHQQTIKEMVLATLSAGSGLCSRHNKPQDHICLSKCEKRCVDCIKECYHRRHKVKARSDVEAKAEKKKRALQSFVETFDSEYEDIDMLLNDHQEVLLKEVDIHFEHFQAEIEKTKDDIRSAVKRYFEVQKEIADESFNHDDQLKNQANHQLEVLNQKLFDQTFFNALRSPIDDLVISCKKPRIETAINMLNNHIEVFRINLASFLAQIPTLFKAQDSIDGPKLEPLHNEKEEFVGNGEEMRMPIIETEEDYLRAISLFYAKIEEENNRLILSFKNQQRETTSLLNDHEKLSSINQVTLQINKSREWKEAIENFRWIWNKFGKVIDLKIDFSFKDQAEEILQALTEESDIWATKDLSEFTIDLSESQVQDKDVKKLYEKAISKMTNLQRLEIVLENTEITDISIKEFAENTLPKLASLTDVRFYVDSTKVSDDAMEELLTRLSNRNKNLTGLAFGFDETAITDKTIENMANSLRSLGSELSKLDVSANKTNISDNSLKILSEAFDSQLNKLKEFALDLGCTDVSNEGLKLFVQSTLPRMASLEVFELYLNEQKYITNLITRPIAQNLRPLSNLKKICLELGGADISGNTLVDIEKSTLSNKPALETFELYIAETNMLAQDINSFLKKIGENQTFQNLYKLSFCFSRLPVTDKSCEALAKSIQCMKKLQILQLLLGETKITDLGLKSLSDGLYQTLPKTKLTEFKLYLHSTGVTDEGLKVFSNRVVRNLTGVKSFELYLLFLKGVTDNGVEVLLEDLSVVAGSLRKIDLSLYATGITDGCMAAVSKALWKVKPFNLESFELSLGKNQNITDESLRYLCSLAPILYNLKSLKLNVEETSVSREGIELLERYWLQGSNALERLEIKA